MIMENEAPQFKNVNDPVFNEWVENKKRNVVEKLLREGLWKDFSQFPVVWVARDKDDNLWLYTHKPRKSLSYFYESANCKGSMEIDNEKYPEITFENSPIQVRLVFVPV